MKPFDRDRSQEIIVKHISLLIRHYGRILQNENHSPLQDPDKSDDLIKSCSVKVTTLRKLRNEFENVTIGFNI